MTRVLVLIPMLGRAERVPFLVENVRATQRETPTDLRFILSPRAQDEDVYQAVLDAGAKGWEVPWTPGPGDFARKINYGTGLSEQEWIFTGASDLLFHPFWADHALHTARKTGARVIGTNDMGKRALSHATHFLVHRSYYEEGTITDAPAIFHEGYDHQYVDNELIATARMRRTYAHATHARVEHLHPYHGKAPMDPTYEKATRETRKDGRMWVSRRKLVTREERRRARAR